MKTSTSNATRTKAGNRLPDVPKERWEEVILATVRRVPAGWVATYGQIAMEAGLGRRSRLVGQVLQSLDRTAADIPWQRIVNAKGEISYSFSRNGSDVAQRRVLEAEGIEFDRNERIDLDRFRWPEGA